MSHYLYNIPINPCKPSGGHKFSSIFQNNYFSNATSSNQTGSEDFDFGPLGDLNIFLSPSNSSMIIMNGVWYDVDD